MWPPEVHDYNDRFTRLLSNIKRRHDPVVTTVAQGILEFKRDKRSTHIDRSIQTFLDRFYMSRIGENASAQISHSSEVTHLRNSVIGIRVLIGQHIALNRLEPHEASNVAWFGLACNRTLTCSKLLINYRTTVRLACPLRPCGPMFAK